MLSALGQVKTREKRKLPVKMLLELSAIRFLMQNFLQTFGACERIVFL